jgi:flagellar basal-body rod modification protein FlgD
MSTSAISSATSTDTSNNSANALASTDPQAAQDRFLKLLVAQLANQDPMNPMDNAQMTSQMAQINTVTQIAQVNQTLLGMQMLQGTSIVGHNVLVPGNDLVVSNGTGAGAVDLSGAADSVNINIMADGNVIDTVKMGAQTQGQHAFNWDASKYSGSGKLSFQVSATNNGASVDATALTVDKVVAVSTSNNTLSVQTQNHGSVAYSSVSAVL